jgi:hypothetical protein
MVYLAIKDDDVKVYFDEQAMFDDGATQEKTVTDEEFNNAGGMVRIIGGEIILGLTPAEKEEGERAMRINDCKVELAEIDQEAGAGRIIRAIALEAGMKAGMKEDPDDPAYNDDYKRLCGYERRAGTLRGKIKALCNR